MGKQQLGAVQLSYFAMDGNYGTADCVLLDTSAWSESDWAEVEEAPDHYRMDIAIAISKKYGR